MKKTMMVTAIVLAAAFISTICFGVALGSTEMRNYWKTGSSSLIDAIEHIGNNTDYEWSAADEQQFLRGAYVSEVEMPQDKTYVSIKADVAKIIIKPSQDGKVSARADIYSKDSNYQSDKYELTSDSEYDILLKYDDSKQGSCIAVLTICIPAESVKEIRLISDVGDVNVMDISLDKLTANISVGNLEIHKSSVKSADITVDTGNVNLEDSFEYTDKLNVTVNIGNLDLNLPKSAGFKLSYSMDVGALDTNNLNLSDYQITDSNGNGTHGIDKKGQMIYNPSSADVGSLILINVNVSIGDANIK